MQEIWKDIPGFEGLYQVSNLGNVKSLLKNKIMFQDYRNGYKKVHLTYEYKKRKSFSVHRLVAQTFIPNLENKPFINHKDGIKDNNNIENLEWCTNSENIKHAYQVLGVKPNKSFLGRFGILHPNSKKIKQYDKNHNFIKEWECMNEVERILKISRKNIGSCCNGKLKSCGGFIWEFA